MALKRLQSALPGKVIVRDGEEYENYVNSYNFLSARQRPLCVVNPTSPEDIAAAIKVLKEFPETTFAVRSGGHSPHPDVANTDKGVVINLKGLDSITESKEHEGVYETGPGVEWLQVYDLLEKKQRSASGSRETTVGVGGFVTGGGLTHFSPERGFACDDVVNMQVVLASGEIVHTNETINPDLFRALKGGRSNFGIVTRLDLQSHPRERTWGGALRYPGTTEDAQIEAFYNFKKSGSYDQYAQTELSFIYSGAFGASFISNNLWYGKEIEHPPAFKWFEDIQPQLKNSMRLDMVSNFAKELAGFNPKNQQAVYITTTFKITSTIMKKINDIWKEAIPDLGSVQNILSVMTYQQCPPPPLSDHPNAMGFLAQSKPHEDLIVLIHSLYWDQASDSDFVRKLGRELMDKYEEVTKAEGVFHRFKYMNYAAPWQPVLEGYGSEAYTFLKEVSMKYDPMGFFQKQGLGFLL